MYINSEEIRYVLYARKSEESEDRQVQSIDDQINLMKKLASDYGINVVEIIQESKSAKDPGRPEFNKMLEKIESGEVTGILCWQINRLTRNPIDGGKLQYLLQSEKIKCIRCVDRQYLPGDNALIFSIETGTANQFILDLKKNTKRGLQTKLEKGWLPGRAPVGYMNDKFEEQGNKRILVDEERFDIVRKMWDLLLSGGYTVQQIFEIADKKWKFRTIQRKRTGGGRISYPGMHSMFRNKFFAGIIVRNGKEYKGSHVAMVTMDEFNRVQEILNRKEKPMGHIREFPYTGTVRCGQCGCMITAYEKDKKNKTTGIVKSYRYYTCTKKKKHLKCSQKAITGDDLNDQIYNLLSKCRILPEFRDWGIEVLKEINKKEIEDRNKIYNSQNNNILDLQKQLDSLTTLRLRGLIEDDEFIVKREKLKHELKESGLLFDKTKDRAMNWSDRIEKILNYIVTSSEEFENMSFPERRGLLLGIGQNFILKDGKVSFDKDNIVIEIEKEYPKLEQEYLELELDKTLDSKEKIELLHSIKSVWGGIRGSNP